jgi:hypothetical protein
MPALYFVLPAVFHENNPQKIKLLAAFVKIW